jgi:putative flippase GtrA
MSTIRPVLPPVATAPPRARPRPRPGALVTQLVRFAVVGASNTVLTFVTYMLAALVVPAVGAAVLGWIVGAANGYRLNSAWTFKDSGVRGARPVARYLVAQALGAAVSAGGVWLLRGDAPHSVTELVSLPVASALTFVLCRFWVFAA